MNEILMLAARRYEFERDGRHIQGCELTYVQRDSDRATNRVGHSPLKVQAPVAVWEQLVHVPGIYNLELRFRPGRDSKADFSVTGAHCLGSVQIFTLDRVQNSPAEQPQNTPSEPMSA